MTVDDFIIQLGEYYQDGSIGSMSPKGYKFGVAGRLIGKYFEKNQMSIPRLAEIFARLVDRFPRTYKTAPGIAEIKTVMRELPPPRHKVTALLEDNREGISPEQWAELKEVLGGKKKWQTSQSQDTLETSTSIKQTMEAHD